MDNQEVKDDHCRRKLTIALVICAICYALHNETVLNTLNSLFKIYTESSLRNTIVTQVILFVLVWFVLTVGL